MIGWIVLAAVTGFLAGAAATVVILRRTLGSRRAPTPAQESPVSRMAKDIGVLSELLADRLAKVWLADGGPKDADRADAVFHHVRESTAIILERAGASPKAAMAVSALTAKKVRPGPIRQPDESRGTPPA